MVRKKDFWRNKAVLVTGGAGFIGSRIAKKLIQKRARVAILDIKKRIPDADPETQKILKRGTYICGDVRNERLVSTLLKKHKFVFVFHLAALAIVEEALANPRTCLDTNIAGTWNILEAARTFSPRTTYVIVASSDKAYGAHVKLPYKEDFELRGTGHPYDASKGSADMLARMYAKVYGLHANIVRCGNVYGGGDLNFSRLIPDTIRSFYHNKNILIRSDGLLKRDYIHINDVVDAYLAVGEWSFHSKGKGEAFNFGHNTPHIVLGVVSLIQTLMHGHKGKAIVLNKAQYEIKRQYLDASKAKKILKWRPHVSLEVGLKESIRWYSDYFSHYGTKT